MSYGGTMVYYEVDLPRMAVPWYCTANDGGTCTTVYIPWYWEYYGTGTMVRIPWYCQYQGTCTMVCVPQYCQLPWYTYHGTRTMVLPRTTVLLWYNLPPENTTVLPRTMVHVPRYCCGTTLPPENTMVAYCGTFTMVNVPPENTMVYLP